MKELQLSDHNYKIIKKCRKCRLPINTGEVFPKVFWRGLRNSQMCSIEELVGPSMHEVFTNYQQNQFSNSTIALIGLQVVVSPHVAEKTSESAQSRNNAQQLDTHQSPIVLQHH